MANSDSLKLSETLLPWQTEAIERARADGYATPEDMVAQATKRASLNAHWHLYPWKAGFWANAKGEIYRGNGGNEREEFSLYTTGPWLFIEIEEFAEAFEVEHSEANAARKELARLRKDVDTLFTSTHGN